MTTLPILNNDSTIIIQNFFAQYVAPTPPPEAVLAVTALAEK